MSSVLTRRIALYHAYWLARGYPDGIPDSVPAMVRRERLAPSWEAIGLAILQNDHYATSLGFSAPKSQWYNAIKKHELDERET